METKRCSKCGNDLLLSAFYQRAGAKSRHSACKVCERAMAKDWYERNKDKATAKVKEWRQQNIGAVKQYRIDNRQKHYRQELVRKYGVEPTWFDEQIRQQYTVVRYIKGHTKHVGKDSGVEKNPIWRCAQWFMSSWCIDSVSSRFRSISCWDSILSVART